MKNSKGPRRVAWFSPFSRGSDVSRFTHSLLPHMQAERDPNWSFALFINDNGRRFESILPSAGVESVDATAQLLSLFDFPIYNVGNNTENHGQIVKVLRQRPGTVVLHDMVYQHLLAWECMERHRSRALYARVMGEVHGPEGLDAVIKSDLLAANGVRRYSIWDTPLAESFPLLTMITGLASSVVVHSEYAEQATRSVFKGPVLRLALPWDQKPSLTDDEIAAWTADTQQTRRCTFVAFGHVSRTKNLDRLIRAFLVHPELSQLARLIIVGYSDDQGYRRELEQLVAQHNLDGIVTFEYSVSDTRLRALKLEADAFVNIRMPITEAASGSLTEQLNTAKPVVVYGRGPYAELPDDAAIKLDPERGDVEIADAMVALAQDPETRIRIGAAGREHVRHIGSADYVARLKNFLTAEESTLVRRQRHTIPVSGPKAWSAADVSPGDSDWFGKLTRARDLWNVVDFDPRCNAPAPFLDWPADQAVRYGLNAILGVDESPELHATAMEIFAARGGWEFYRIIQLLRRKLWLARLHVLPDRLNTNDASFVGDLDYWRLAIHFEAHLVARLFFVSLLGHGWELGEDLIWGDLLNSEPNSGMVMAKFVALHELHERKDIAREIEEILVWCRTERRTSVHRSPDAGELFNWPVSTTVRFGGAGGGLAPLLHAGWYEPEPEGRWLQGRHGLLRFIPVGRGELALDLTFRLIGSQAVGPREITVASSLGYSQTILVDSDVVRTFSVHLPIGESSSKPITLRLSISQSVSLAELKLGDDSRGLGIMLLSGELRPVVAGALVVPRATIVKTVPRPLPLMLVANNEKPSSDTDNVSRAN